MLRAARHTHLALQNFRAFEPNTKRFGKHNRDILQPFFNAVICPNNTSVKQSYLGGRCPKINQQHTRAFSSQYRTHRTEHLNLERRNMKRCVSNYTLVFLQDILWHRH